MDTLPGDFELAVRIYEYGKKGEPVWFTKLVEDTERDGTMSRATVSKNIDKLFDLGIINGEWDKQNGKWVRAFKITGEASRLIASISKKHPIRV